MITTTSSPIMVLEDSDEDFDTVTEAVTSAGIENEIYRVTTGDACLDLLRGNTGRRIRPALVLMDLNTPGLDGREAIEAIKSDASLRYVPIVVLTTSSNPKDLRFCYNAGANAYHIKPIRYKEHLKVIHELLQYWLGTVVVPLTEDQ